MRKYKWSHLPVTIICSHTDKKKYAFGLCCPCYKKQHYLNVKSSLSPEKFRIWVFNNHIKSRYQVTLEWYQTIFEKQNGRCPCGRIFGYEKPLLPCIDHNHSCCDGYRSCGQCVRGLLCARCNQVLGMLEEDPKLLPAYLLQYLESYVVLQKTFIS